MKPIKHNFNDLRLTINKTNTVWKFVFTFEVLIVIILGILASKYTKIDFTSESFILLVIFSVIYLLIKLFFLSVNKIINKSPVDELEAKFELGLYKKGFSRINIVNETISKSLHMLNDQTCFLTTEEHQEERSCNICEQNLKDGLSEVLGPFMKNISIIFDTNNLKFTLGVFIERFWHIGANNTFEIKDHIVIINDDHDFEKFVQSDLYSQSNPKDIALEIQSVLKKSFNNNRFIEQHINKDGKTFNMISSIIPCVCTGENQDGVLFIIIEPLENDLPDFMSTIDIFNRIITNWLSCYKKCLQNKLLAPDLID